MKNLIFLEDIRLPTEKAHGIQIINTSLELAKKAKENGVNFELIISDRSKKTIKEIFEYYNLNNAFQFKIKQIKTIPLFRPFFISYFLQKFQFILKSQVYLFWNYGFNVTLFTRDWILAFAMFGKVRMIFWETHTGQKNLFVKLILRFGMLDGLVCISQGLANFYEDVWAGRTLVAHDAVNLIRYEASNLSKDEIREKLNLPKESKIVSYIGSIGLYNWKGVDVFLEAAKDCKDIIFLVVGGNEKEITNLKKQFPYENVHFVGFQNQEKTPLYRFASDILVIPNKKGDKVSEHFTSPLKLFSSMASGTPILASDLPSLREVLMEGNATFFEANNSKDLASQILSMFQKYEVLLEKARKAREDVKEYSYEKRAEKIWNFITIKS